MASRAQKICSRVEHFPSSKLASGMSRLTWDLDPLSAATVRGFVDTYVNTLHHGKEKPEPLRLPIRQGTGSERAA
jgi:hypothetical protein